MKTFDEIYANMRWNTDFNSMHIRELIKPCLDTEMTPQEIGDYVIKEVNVIDKVSLDHIRSCIESTVDSYRAQHEEVKDASRVLNSIYNRILSIKKDVSNTIFFGLDKVDYTDSELEALNRLNQALNEFELLLFYKVPPCRHKCQICPINGKRGCKIENNPIRAREWGIEWVNV